jgi:hypothetical protein
LSKLIAAVKEQRAALTLMPVAAFFLFLVWFLFAPRPDCYYQKGQCVYFVTQNSDFFYMDLWFAGPALVIGLLFGLGFAKAWYKAGIVFQILVALIATGLSWAVVFVASLASPAERIDEYTRLSNLELRSVGALFIWAFATQMVMVFRGQDDESSDRSDDDSAGTF